MFYDYNTPFYLPLTKHLIVITKKIDIKSKSEAAEKVTKKSLNWKIFFLVHDFFINF